MALVGDNGAGKSTLIKCLAGHLPVRPRADPVAGSSPSASPGPKDSARLGIEVVYQDLALCDNLDVVENMYLGRETLSIVRRLDEAKMEREARRVLRELSVTTVQSVRLPVATHVRRASASPSPSPRPCCGTQSL